jgi:hypothetical protein
MTVVAAGNEADGETSDCLWWDHGDEDELLTAGEMHSGDGTSIGQSSCIKASVPHFVLY